MRRYPGELLEGLLMSSPAGRVYPDMVRANRVRVYRPIERPIEQPRGLSKGEFLYLVGTRAGYDLSRRGLWLVLEYFLGAARYRVLHFDARNQLHDVRINVGDLESDRQFRTVRKRKERR